MFALPIHPVQHFSTPSFLDLPYHPTHSFVDVDPHADYLASHRYHQHQLALQEQLRQEDLARRRRQYEEDLAYHAALVHQAQLEEQQRRQEEALRQMQLREQRRREEEKRRQLHQVPSLFDLLFRHQPVDTDEYEDLADPRDAHLAAQPSSVPVAAAFSPSSSAADQRSPPLSASPVDWQDVVDSHDPSPAPSCGADSRDSSSSFPAHDEALSTLSALRSSFTGKRDAFTAPTALAFQPSPSPLPDARSPSPPLAFTSSNAPLLEFEDFLVTLLSKIDTVESHGDAPIRGERKALVREVEAELKRLDELKDSEWERQSGESGSSAAESETEEDAEMSAADNDEQDSSPTSDILLPVPSNFHVPFAYPASLQGKNSHASPAPSDPEESSDDEDDFVAQTLLSAGKLGEEVSRMEEEEEHDEEEEGDEEESDDEEVLLYL
ncbi:hypothetical protein JCM10213_005432 [Rhodosporidiobolus nylandii]